MLLLDIIGALLAQGPGWTRPNSPGTTTSARPASATPPGRLALEGLVDRRPRIGTSVVLLDMTEIRQASRRGCLIEPHCASLAAIRATPVEIHAIGAAFDGYEAALKRQNFALLVSMDQTFHRAVAIGTHNPALIRIVGLLHHKAARYWSIPPPPRRTYATTGRTSIWRSPPPSRPATSWRGLQNTYRALAEIPRTGRPGRHRA